MKEYRKQLLLNKVRKNQTINLNMKEVKGLNLDLELKEMEEELEVEECK